MMNAFIGFTDKDYQWIAMHGREAFHVAIRNQHIRVSFVTMLLLSVLRFSGRESISNNLSKIHTKFREKYIDQQQIIIERLKLFSDILIQRACANKV